MKHLQLAPLPHLLNFYQTLNIISKILFQLCERVSLLCHEFG